MIGCFRLTRSIHTNTNVIFLLATITICIALLSSLPTSIGRIIVVPSTEAFTFASPVFSLETRRTSQSRWGSGTIDTANSYCSSCSNSNSYSYSRSTNSYRTQFRSGSAPNGNRAPVRVCLCLWRDEDGGGVEQEQEGGVQVQVRDWKKGDGKSIMDLLLSLESTSSDSKSGGLGLNNFNNFNPEGPLDIDCSSEDLIQESYSEDGACMLVATTTIQQDGSGSGSYNEKGGSGGNSERIVGTAALTVGTPVTYLKSGASMSSPADITGAIRRVCAVDESILQPLLRSIEIRASEAGVGQLILLAYPNPESERSTGAGATTTAATAICRPGTALLKSMGYEELPINLKGVDAVQYGKNLVHVDQSQNQNDANTNAAENSNADANADANANANAVNNSSLKQLNNHSSNEKILDAAVGASFLAILLAFVLGVGNFMGLELLPSIGSSGDNNNNRGIGSPLSVQELELLRQDERLQRTDLDGGAGASASTSGGASAVDDGIRQWKDLSFEERQEEAAMMKIIQGQTTRLK
mmetsp:Transcript_20283/g.30770  ORF Transcript_20283/g.30770 Transcript_20283/m.30770 type:complete len:527 (-) Transcript_20283:30-1610(-)